MKIDATKKDTILIGSWINSCSPIIAEIMSAVNFDFLVVDTEHSAVDVAESLQLLQAIKAGNPKCFPIVRLPNNDYSETKRFLDAGFMGVIAPLINTKEQAVEVIKAVKYPPMGERGVGFGRSHGYGFLFDEYMNKANDETFVCVQIEHIHGVKNIDSILSVDGINAALIGPYDLTASMGITAEFSNPDYLEIVNLILNKCKEYNILPGIHVVQPHPAEVLKNIEKGFKFIGYSLDITVIGTCYRNDLRKIREELKR